MIWYPLASIARQLASLLTVSAFFLICQMWFAFPEAGKRGGESKLFGHRVVLSSRASKARFARRRERPLDPPTRRCPQVQKVCREHDSPHRAQSLFVCLRCPSFKSSFYSSLITLSDTLNQLIFRQLSTK